MWGLLIIAVAYATIFVAMGWLIPRCCKHCRRRNATRIVYVEEGGKEMQDIQFTEGDAPRAFRTKPLKDDDTIDESVESVHHGYGSEDSGQTTAPDGSSSFVVTGDNNLVLVITPGTPSALDGAGNPIPSEIRTGLDSATEPGQDQFIHGLLRVTTLAKAKNATHVDYEEVPVPEAAAPAPEAPVQ